VYLSRDEPVGENFIVFGVNPSTEDGFSYCAVSVGRLEAEAQEIEDDIFRLLWPDSGEH
jgi:hypothetical protein